MLVYLSDGGTKAKEVVNFGQHEYRPTGGSHTPPLSPVWTLTVPDHQCGPWQFLISSVDLDMSWSPVWTLAAPDHQCGSSWSPVCTLAAPDHQCGPWQLPITSVDLGSSWSPVWTLTCPGHQCGPWQWQHFIFPATCVDLCGDRNKRESAWVWTWAMGASSFPNITGAGSLATAVVGVYGHRAVEVTLKAAAPLEFTVTLVYLYLHLPFAHLVTTGVTQPVAAEFLLKGGGHTWRWTGAHPA